MVTVSQILKMNAKIALLLCIFVFVASVFWIIAGTKTSIKRYQVYDLFLKTNAHVQKRSEKIEKIFTHYFDEAARCNQPNVNEQAKCRQKVSIRINEAYNVIEREGYCGHRESTFFVKIRGTNIEVLTLSGGLKILSEADNLKYRKVICFIQNPISQLIDRVFNIYDDTVYLEIYPSESELIIPFVRNGVPMGGILKLCAT